MLCITTPSTHQDFLTSPTHTLFHLHRQGDILEEVHDVELNNNASFYRAILAVHKENYGLAMSLIHETREQLSGVYCTTVLHCAVLYCACCMCCIRLCEPLYCFALCGAVLVCTVLCVLYRCVLHDTSVKWICWN